MDTVGPLPAPTHPDDPAFPSAFRQLMINSLVSGVTSTFLWFALTFWVCLETRSVVTTGVIAGTSSLVAAVVGSLIGTFTGPIVTAPPAR
jgi:DHA3 family multidrug efflux protein-like MFS transporter